MRWIRSASGASRRLSSIIGQDAAQANARAGKDLLGVEVGEDFLALFEGAAQRGIFHEEPEGLAAAVHLRGDHAGRRVDAGDPAGGHACIPLQHLWRGVGGETAEGKRQDEKHEAERAEAAEHRAARFIFNVNHGYASSLSLNLRWGHV